MSYTPSPLVSTSNRRYGELLSRIKIEEEREAALREIRDICQNCRPASPIMCVDLCKIWRLKKAHQEELKSLSQGPSVTSLLRQVTDNGLLKILEALVEAPLSSAELRTVLNKGGCGQDQRASLDRDTNSLIDLKLVETEGENYKATLKGRRVHDVLTKSEVSGFPFTRKGKEEAILMALYQGPKTRHKLARIVDTGDLEESLVGLLSGGLVNEPDSEGSTLYRVTKRRATRKLTPLEARIFEALKEEETTAENLSNKLGIGLDRVLNCLKRLRYKRHVDERQVPPSYRLTEKGRSLIKSLKMAHSILAS